MKILDKSTNRFNALIHFENFLWEFSGKNLNAYAMHKNLITTCGL